MPLVNYNSRKEVFVSKQLKNGQRYVLKYEVGTSKQFAIKKFMESYELKNNMI